jgi:AP-1 complex subunit beta-1
MMTVLSEEILIGTGHLRSLNLSHNILKHEMKVFFFVKYNDPTYIKLEKLNIMIWLTSQVNIAHVLSELKEYSTKVDVDFERKSVSAIKVERCVSTPDLIQTKVNYVVQEAVVVIKDILRKYPNKYESIIATLCENLDLCVFMRFCRICKEIK